MRLSLFLILLINIFSVGCVTTKTPIEDDYLGSKTNFEDVVLVKGLTLEVTKDLILKSLNEHNFSLVLNDSNQDVLVAKKKYGITNTFITSSIYLFEESNGIKVRIISNLPKDYSSGFEFHTKLIQSLSEN